MLPAPTFDGTPTHGKRSRSTDREKIQGAYASPPLMKIRAGLVLSFLVVTLQWLVVSSFVEHSYTWWLKAEAPEISAGITGTVLFAIGSLLAIGFSLWAHDQLYNQKSNLKYAAQLLAMAGLSGLLVFFSMVFVGYVALVHR